MSLSPKPSSRPSLLCRVLLLALLPLSAQAQTYTQTEDIVYHDNASKWVMGQVASRTVNGLTVSQTGFDTTYALPLTYDAFGKRQQTLTWDTSASVASGQRGTAKTVQDGNNRITTATSWKRGIPQSIAFADSTSVSAVVNDSGWITAVIDENGYRNCYGYDAMGRLSQVTYPSETVAGVCDSSAWGVTTQVFAKVASDEYGIAAGHWRQTVATGTARRIAYYDALWRPLLTREYDTANEAGTTRFQRHAYDYQGRTTFTAYPGTTDALSTGTRTAYDALDRVKTVTQDSELGVLTTATAYLTGFRTEITDPKGYKTTTYYMAYDQPVTDWPVLVAQPEGAYTHITRDIFGKPTQLRRSNTLDPAGGTTALNRTYAYNTNQELCRTVEPETGATLMGYDGAGNLKWSAAGLGSGTACEANGTSTAVAARRVDRTYDARNRLLTLAFPDSQGNQSWAYTPDGLPDSITTYNAAGNGQPVVNTYGYNRRRLPTAETSATDGTTWSLGYVYNVNGHLRSQSYPSGLTVSYAPNALGQPTQAGAHATGVTYHPNGAIKGFTYGNGIVHAMTQNARQLPQRSTDCTTTGTCATANQRLDLGYGFDANANVSQITDHIDGRQTRGMSYDGRDRLTQTTSSPFGTAIYTYDVLDNLTRVQIGGPGARDHGYCYTNNRLTALKAANCSGSTVVSLAYDVQGNLASKGSQGYSFDTGNRLRTATGLESYRYDGLGRRVRSESSAGTLRSQYSLSGQLLYAEDARTAKRTDYIYLNGRLIAQRERPLGGSTVTMRYLHTDALGSPIATTDASKAFVEKTEYEPYGKVLNRPLRDGPGYTGHMEDAATGLNYMQQRYYDPQIGSFLSVDPVTAFSNPVGQFHRYRYANGNPYRYTDPTGMEGWAGCEGGTSPCISYAGPMYAGSAGGGSSRGSSNSGKKAEGVSTGGANEGSSENGTDIRLDHHPLPTIGHHAEAQIINPDSQGRDFRVYGGPEKPASGWALMWNAVRTAFGGNQFGTVVAGIASPEKGIPAGADAGASIMVRVPLSYDEAVVQATRYVESINSAHVRYSVLGPNSNSVAYGLSVFLGGPLASPPVLAPGAGPFPFPK